MGQRVPSCKSRLETTPPPLEELEVDKRPVTNLHHRGEYVNALQRGAAVVVAGAGEGAGAYFEEARVEEDGFEVDRRVEQSGGEDTVSRWHGYGQ